MAVSSNAPHVPQPTVVFLEVRRGATRAPRRPFPIGRFLIGSGAQCDVKLGGDDIPLLHSILRADGRDVVLESVAQNPPLIVNGTAVDSARLQSGDVVAIGAFEFVVDCLKSVELAKPTAAKIDDVQTANLAKASASELVDMLEAEMNEIDDFQSRRLLGAGALLQAALDRASVACDADETQEHAKPIDVSSHPPLRIAATADAADESDPELDEMIARLDNFSSQLESRSQRLAEREAKYLEAAAELLKSQQRLAENLELLQKQVESLASIQPKSLRASA